MIDLSLLKEKICPDSSSDKLVVGDNIVEIFEYLKNSPEYDFSMLITMTGVEIIYQLYSVTNNYTLNLSYYAINGTAPSVSSVYKSANFDECEIFDLFGIVFTSNNSLKRLLLPESWVGHPLLKSYELNDKRLVWNE